jgi:hypothetical protein
VLAYGIKYLEKSLVEHFDRFAKTMITLFFRYPNQTVRQIAGEAISFLLKKVNYDFILKRIINSI